MHELLEFSAQVLYQDKFASIDTDNDGIITAKSLGLLLRNCGENPSEAEIQVSICRIKIHSLPL